MTFGNILDKFERYLKPENLNKSLKEEYVEALADIRTIYNISANFAKNKFEYGEKSGNRLIIEFIIQLNDCPELIAQELQDRTSRDIFPELHEIYDGCKLSGISVMDGLETTTKRLYNNLWSEFKNSAGALHSKTNLIKSQKLLREISSMYKVISQEESFSMLP